MKDLSELYASEDRPLQLNCNEEQGKDRETQRFMNQKIFMPYYTGSEPDKVERLDHVIDPQTSRQSLNDLVSQVNRSQSQICLI